MTLLASTRLFVAAAVCLLAAPARADNAAPPPPDPDESVFSCKKPVSRVKVTFKDEVSLADLVTWAMGFSCRNFVYASRVRSESKVVLVTPREMSPAEAWQAFLVALRSMRLAVVRKGDVLEIVEAPQAKQHGLPLGDPSKLGRGESYQRAVFRPQHVPTAQLQLALTALKSESGEIAELPDAGVILVADYAANIGRMAALARDIDLPRADEQVYVLRVENGDAAAIAGSLEAILGTEPAPRPRPAAQPSPRAGSAAATAPAPAAAASAAPIKIVADTRTRSILIIGSEAVYQRAQALVRQLDLPVDSPDSGHIHLVPLEHANAEALATTLQSLVSNRPPAAAGNDRAGAPTRPAAPETASLAGDVRVSFDKPSNALLVMASTQDYLVLREVIRRLDTRQTQVFIEATILDITIEGDRLARGAFHGGALHDGAVWLTGLQYTDLHTMLLGDGLTSGDAREPGLALDGLLGGVIGPNLLGTSIPSFAVLFQALAKSRNANLLSAPSVMTVDNAQAKITVGSQIAAPGGTTVTADVVRTDVQRVDVDLKLTVTPHVSSDQEIRLDIDLSIASLISIDPTFGPSISVRTVTNSVVVADQESVVIGGLISDEEIRDETKIPLLGDIPVLGHLFKRTIKKKNKQNLVILLTPYIVDDRLASEMLLREKLRERDEFARSFTSLDAARFEPRVDYRKKRGLLEEINRRVTEIEGERAAIEEAIAPPPARPEGRIWPVEPAEVH